jgi:hypothetical protein
LGRTATPGPRRTGTDVGRIKILMPPFFPPSDGSDVGTVTRGRSIVGGNNGISIKGGRIGCRPAPPPFSPLPVGHERE